MTMAMLLPPRMFRLASTPLRLSTPRSFAPYHTSTRLLQPEAASPSSQEQPSKERKAQRVQDAAPKITLEQLTSDHHCLYWEDSEPPTQAQLQYADAFFANHRASRIWSQNTFSKLPFVRGPEILLVGRTNVGRSQLINTLTGQPLCGSVRNKSVNMAYDAYEIGPRGWAFTLVEAFGYGKKSRDEWGPMMEKYLTKRKGLVKVFVVVDASQGIQPRDWDMISHLSYLGIPNQILLSKTDRLLFTHSERGGSISLERIERLQKWMREIGAGLPQETDRELIGYCAWRKKVRGFGVSQVRWAMLKAAGFHRDLEKKRPGKQ